MDNTIKVLPRIYVNDLMANISFYKKLLCSDPLTIIDISLNKIARFDNLLLIEAKDESVKEIKATILVRSIVQAKNRCIRNNVKIISEPSLNKNGMMMIVQHPDGQIFEYIEIRRFVP